MRKPKLRLEAGDLFQHAVSSHVTKVSLSCTRVSLRLPKLLSFPQPFFAPLCTHILSIMPIELLIKDHPPRSIALLTPSHALILRNSSSLPAVQSSGNSFSASIPERINDPSSSPASAPKCIIEFLDLASVDLDGYRSLSSQPCLGTLGLITLNQHVFLGVVTSAREVASVRPGEGVFRINAVNFRMPLSLLSRSLF